MLMNFNLVLEDQGLGGILGQRLFFEPSKLAFGFLVSRFVPFAFHGVLGAMHRKMFLMQEATNLIAAEANSCKGALNNNIPNWHHGTHGRI